MTKEYYLFSRWASDIKESVFLSDLNDYVRSKNVPSFLLSRIVQIKVNKRANKNGVLSFLRGEQFANDYSIEVNIDGLNKIQAVACEAFWIGFGSGCDFKG